MNVCALVDGSERYAATTTTGVYLQMSPIRSVSLFRTRRNNDSFRLIHGVVLPEVSCNLETCGFGATHGLTKNLRNML